MEMREYLAAEDKQHRAHLEEHKKVIGGLLEEVKAQRDEIAQEAAQVVKASGKEAVAQAQEALNLLGKAAKEVGDAANKTSEMAATAAQRSGEILGQMDQASQRMLISEQKVEAALDALVPKVAEARGKLEKDLSAMVGAAGGTEAEIQRMVAAIRTSMTNEIHTEIRKKLYEAAGHATRRVHNFGSLWERFLKSLVILFPLTVLAAGGLGWWFGQHYLEEGIYAKTLAQVKANANVRACAYQFHEDLKGVMQPKFVSIDAPLVWTAPGKFALMTKNEQGQWVYGKAVVNPGILYSAECWDSSNKDTEQNTIKAYKP